MYLTYWNSIDREVKITARKTMLTTTTVCRVSDIFNHFNLSLFLRICLVPIKFELNINRNLCSVIYIYSQSHTYLRCIYVDLIRWILTPEVVFALGQIYKTSTTIGFTRLLLKSAITNSCNHYGDNSTMNATLNHLQLSQILSNCRYGPRKFSKCGHKVRREYNSRSKELNNII